jgi:uncharacterized protein
MLLARRSAVSALSLPTNGRECEVAMQTVVPPPRNTSPEWPEGIDVAALKAGGWKPKPFNQFILKIHSRCNLACDYCYMYELADQSWLSRPRIMSREVIRAAASRISDHAARHQLPAVNITLHGGEPLLAGAELIDFLAREMRTAISPDVKVNLTAQTNGILLSSRILDVLLSHEIRVGISLDGDQAANDSHRRYRTGRGSYQDVVQGIQRLKAGNYQALFAGLLAVIDLRNDPVACYENLAKFEPPEINFLLPHGTWKAPPRGKEQNISNTRYGDWLIQAFDHWYGLGKKRIEVRLFRSVVRLLLGKAGLTEQLGLSPATFVVIETDGYIEQVDSLKAAFYGAPETGFHIANHDLSDVSEHPGIVARQIGTDGLCATCQNCRLRDVCGGGMYTQRYRSGSGFLNPSVYCADLMKFIDHASIKVSSDLAEIRPN